MIRGVINSNSFGNPRKLKVLLCAVLCVKVEGFTFCRTVYCTAYCTLHCTVCGSEFSVAHEEEININRHKDTSKYNGYADVAQ